jgi:sporulation integral membrane protein YtvI
VIVSLERRKGFIINTGYVVLMGLIFYVVVKYLFGLVAPFVVGFLVAALLQRSIQFLSRKLRLPRKLLAVVCVFLFYAVIGILLFWLGVGLFAWLKNVVERLPSFYAVEIEPLIMQGFDSIEGLTARFDVSLVQLLEDFHVSMSQSIGKIVSDVSSAAIAAITSTVSWLPRLFLGVVLSIISSVFFALDYELITEFLSNLVPHQRRGLIAELKTLVGGIGVKYTKAYALLMLITFTEMTIGLSILGIDGATTIAAFTAVVDIFPVLGTGFVVIPWALFHLAKGNLYLGLGLCLLYGVITVVRQILEPKVVGQQIGLHPIVILICMYAGVKIFGVMGLFILPFTILVLKYLYDQGRLRLDP